MHHTWLLGKESNIGINHPTLPGLLSVFGSNTQVFPSSIEVCCTVQENDVLLFVQIVHLRIYLWFSSYQQGVLSKSLLVKAAVYSRCHFTSKKEKIKRSFYRNVISEWKCKMKKTICGNQKQILCLQSISIPYMKRIPFSISILSFHSS